MDTTVVRILDLLTETEESLDKMFVISNDLYDYFERKDMTVEMYYHNRWDALVRNNILSKEVSQSREIIQEAYALLQKLHNCAGANEQQERKHERD